MGHKRKSDNNGGENNRTKKAKSNSREKDSLHLTSHAPEQSSNRPGPSKKPDRPRIQRLAPQRPFPTVASASSATGPRSTHHEGKNNICITRKTKLAAYLRRCKALLVEDGFKELRLCAMGAAIPHLTLLAVSLPPVLPWAEDEVYVDVLTGSLEVHDEMLSESGSEAEDGPREEFRTRVKSTMNVIIRIGQGGPLSNADASVRGPVSWTAKKVERQANAGEKSLRQGRDDPEQIVLQEPEQDSMEIS